MRKKILLFISIAIFTMLILFGIEHFSSLNKKTQEISSSETQPTENTKDTELVIDIPKKEDITINMSVIGDIMCHNSQYQDAFNGSTYDFSYVFSDIKDYISNADIAIGNLETTFAGAERGYSNYPTFNTPEQLAYNLKDFGIDVVSTANNHCMDTGYKGLVSTLNYLDDAGISHTGTSRSSEEQNTVLIKDVNGIKIAFLSFTYGTNGILVSSQRDYSVNLISDDLILNQLALAKEQNPDLICVSMHWGVEYQTIPNAEQKELADFLFNNGADIIIGNHPHVLQNFEKREITLSDGTTKDGFVVYSLGNLLADQNKKYTRDSAILTLNITKDENDKIKINTAKYVPTYIYKDTSKSSQKFKIINIKNAIDSFDAGYSPNLSSSTYNTFKTELSNIKRILGEEIK